MKAGWETKPLGELCDVIGGGTPSKDRPDYYGGDIPWATVRDMRADIITSTEYSITSEALKASATNIIPAGNVVIATRVGLGKVCLLAQDTAVNQDLRGIVPKSNKEIDVAFLFAWFKSISEQIIAEGTGATVQGVKLPFIKGLSVPLPAMEEQRRIVTLLDEAFADIATAKANAEKNLQNAQSIFQTHLDSVFESNSNKKQEKLLMDALADQPRNGWSPPAANHSDRGIPVLTLSAVTGFKFRPEKIKHTSAPTNTDSHYWVVNGDLLLTRSNTPELVGHVAVATDIAQPTIYPDLIMRMNADPHKAINRFLYYQLRSTKHRQIIMDRAHGANPTMKKVGKTDVQTLPIWLPYLHEQQQIANGLEEVEIASANLESIYRQKLTALDDLKKSLLHQAFSGQL